MFGPEFMAKLHMNPQTRSLLSQPDFVAMLKDMGSNPSNMTKYLGDPRLQQALSVGLGINMMSGDQFKEGQGANGVGTNGAGAASSAAAEEDEESDDEMPVHMHAILARCRPVLHHSHCCTPQHHNTLPNMSWLTCLDLRSITLPMQASELPGCSCWTVGLRLHH